MTYLLIGLFLFLLGCAHPLLPSDRWEIKIVHSVQIHLSGKPFQRIFQEIWLFGLTTFALTALVLLTAVNWKIGLVALSIFSITVGIERLVKAAFNRQRPFQEIPQIAMLQPREPHDPSYPSGDVLRIWYLALIISTLLGSPAFWAAAVILALVVSLGRLVMGVHYLSDVIGGAGLGITAAGFTIWLWHMFQSIG
ncbi:MAG: phosphatase PAP2 family protein [Anaerolineales bacterium]